MIKFCAKISRFGKGRYMILIPKAVVPSIKLLIGKELVVTVEEKEE